MIIDVVREFHFVEINRIVHPVSPHRRAVGVYVNPAVEGMLWLCRSRKAPTTHIAAVALIAAVLVPTIGSRCDFQENKIILTLLQTAYIYLNGREHAPVKNQTKLPKSLLNELYSNSAFKILSPSIANMFAKMIICGNIIPFHKRKAQNFPQEKEIFRSGTNKKVKQKRATV